MKSTRNPKHQSEVPPLAS